MEPKTTLLDQMRDGLRLKHMSLRTEEASVAWVRRFILLHHKRHPADMGAPEIRAFLTHLAVHGKVAASTHNGACNALLFLSRHVLTQPCPALGEIERAQRPQRMPTVFTQAEGKAVLAQRSGMHDLMASLLYGAGVHLLECVRLRVHHLDFASHQMTVRDGKGAQDRVTMLPRARAEPLQRHRTQVTLLQEEALLAGYGDVYVPYACERKEPHAGTSWLWPYVFPATQRSVDPRSGVERRHHASEAVIPRAVQYAIQRARVQQRGSCHT